MNRFQIRKIIHVDMDAFFASVEQRDNPEYRGKPLVVGGTADQRGVVAAASYEARCYGIHSAMPARTAAQRCPQLIFVRPRFEVYREVSQQVREIFLRYTDLVEPLSLDEAYLDVTHNKMGLPSATLIAQEIKQCIFAETNLTASAGVSINKFLAKTASAINKPNGLYLIHPEKAESFLEDLPVEKFYGVGRVTAKKMNELGIFDGADLKRWTERDLLLQFGKVGSFYHGIVRGIDERPVSPDRICKSIGAEESYAQDLHEPEAILNALSEIAGSVKRRLDKANASGRTLTLKVKYADYQQVTRSKTVVQPITSIQQMMEIALPLLGATEVERRRVRLLGLTISNFDSEGEPLDAVQLTLNFA